MKIEKTKDKINRISLSRFLCPFFIIKLYFDIAIIQRRKYSQTEVVYC
jgi:hypothetical protein